MTKRRISVEQREAPTLPDLELSGVELASDARVSQVTWLVEGAVPSGAVAILDGRKGTGKSLYAAALAAAVTGGPPVPGYVPADPALVLWCASEDPWESVTVARLLAAGANLKGVCRLRPTLVMGRPVPLYLPDDLGQLRDQLGATRARLLVLDPLMALAAPGLDMGTEIGARAYMQPLADLMWETGTTCIAIRHPTKGRGRDLREAGAGHHSLTNIARSLMRADEHPHEQGRLVVCVASCNYGATLPPQVWRPVPAGEGQVKIEWLGACDLTPDAIAAGRGDEAERDEWADADRLLAGLVGTAWVRASVIQSQAEAAGVTPRMLRRAKARLRVLTRKSGGWLDGWWEWGPPAAGWPAAMAAAYLATPPSPAPPAPSAPSPAESPEKPKRRTKAPRRPRGGRPPLPPPKVPQEDSRNGESTAD